MYVLMDDGWKDGWTGVIVYVWRDDGGMMDGWEDG